MLHPFSDESSQYLSDGLSPKAALKIGFRSGLGVMDRVRKGSVGMAHFLGLHFYHDYHLKVLGSSESVTRQKGNTRALPANELTVHLAPLMHQKNNRTTPPSTYNSLDAAVKVMHLPRAQP